VSKSREFREKAAGDFRPPGAFITHLLDERGLRRTKREVTESLEIHFLDLTPLKLNLGYFVPFVIVKELSAHRSISRDALAQLLPILSEHVRIRGYQFVILVVGGVLSENSPEMRRRYGANSIAIVTRPDIENIVEQQDNNLAWTALAKPLVAYLGSKMLSPYQSGKPASGGRFFGRATALATVLAGRTLGGNFTIIGTRRIGKTSLQHEIRARLERDIVRLRTAVIHGNNIHSSFAFGRELLSQLRPELEKRLDADPSLIEGLPVHIWAIPDKLDHDVAVFVDELDHILEFDAKQGYKLLNLLRATFEHPRCRIVFAGFRSVMEAEVRLDSPLYNFTDSIRLTSLSRSECLEMIRGPLTRLGINIAAGVPEVIMEETSGHPELIQMFCAKVVELNEGRTSPPSASELVEAVSVDEMFRAKVYRTFLMNTNPLEKLLCYCLILSSGRENNAAETEFTLQDCDRALADLGYTFLPIASLESLTENLRVGGVIRFVAGRRTRTMKFAVPRLVEYCLAEDVNYTIIKVKEELATQPGSINPITEQTPEVESAEGLSDK
jgi:hypothetical protein